MPRLYFLNTSLQTNKNKLIVITPATKEFSPPKKCMEKSNTSNSIRDPQTCRACVETEASNGTKFPFKEALSAKVVKVYMSTLF